MAALLAAPVLVFLWLSAHPAQNRALLLPSEHFAVVTAISLLAAGVAVLIARAALRLEQYQVMLITLGFVSLAGFFAVHALATPGVLLAVPSGSDATAPPAAPYDPGYGLGDGGAAYAGPASPGHPSRPPSGAGLPTNPPLPPGGNPLAGVGNPPAAFDYGGTVIGLSAFLSLFVPSFLFAAGYTPLARAIHQRLPFPAGGLVVAVATALATYATAAIARPDVVGSIPLSRPPYSYALAAVSVLLLGFAAWRQERLYVRTRFPSQGALAVAFLLLAEAQVVMVATPFWTVSWWEYHVVMFAAVVLALGALFLELDRRRGLERYLPAEVVDGVVAGDVLRLAGERRVVTVMFADLRDSTTAAEQLPAEAVVELLNAYLGALARCVFAQGGMLDKFLGDGLMAIFGVLPDPSDGAVPAARAALEMRRAVQAVNAARAQNGRAPMQFGVVLHTGEVVLGSIGTPQRSDFTAVGDTVNTAARLEGLSKEFGVDIVLSGQTAARLTRREPAPGTLGGRASGHCGCGAVPGAPSGAALEPRELGEAPIRGRREPVRAFTLAP